MKKLLLLLAAVVCISTTASAQDKGDWAIMPRINIYTAWDADTVFGIGAAARYNVLDQLRLEPALTLLCHDGCSIDLNCDVHYLFPVADRWNLYPLAGISVNDFGDWSAGINLGAGFDYAVADRWDITAGLKYMIETHKELEQSADYFGRRFLSFLKKVRSEKRRAATNKSQPSSFHTVSPVISRPTAPG